MKRLLLIIAATSALATPALAQQKPGNCALWNEMAADTIKRDVRTRGPQRAVVVKALTQYSDAQTKLVEAGMAQSYEQGKAFGYTKEKMDELTATTMAAMRKGFHTSTMDKDKIYMDHVVAVNNCALGAKSEAEFGQSKESMISALEQMMAWAQS
ncbi:MAG: hypothetical protein ACSHX3_08425 [Litorimonas sp.]